jgi:hypothetical protein
MPSRVFLSSTYSDLREHREAALKAIRQLGAVDVAMEHFGARDQRPVDECKRLIKEESDIFLGVYAHRYGFIPKGGKKSISEIEYAAATDARLQRFIYMVDDEHPWLPQHIDGGRQGAKLKAFKEYLAASHICQRFRGPDQLAMNIAADLGRHLAMERSAPIKGGISAPVVSEAQSIGIESLGAIDSRTDWSDRRGAVYQQSRNIFLAHIIRPSAEPGQEYDVFIYLVRHRSTDFSDVRLAEFFLGRYWGNEVFPATEVNGFIGISTAAYGTFLCLCRVTFTDGTQVYLDRYIDFEMGLHSDVRRRTDATSTPR